MATSPIRRINAQQVSHAIITAAMRVHTELGAGLLESAYTACLQHELRETGYGASAQVGLPVVYRGVRVELGYRLDLVVEDLVIVEVKSADCISPVHQAQIISYLKLSGKSLGLLINFQCGAFEGWHQTLREWERMEIKASTTKGTKVHEGKPWFFFGDLRVFVVKGV
jgi:GxxExxY protein